MAFKLGTESHHMHINIFGVMENKQIRDVFNSQYLIVVSLVKS